MNAIPTLRPSLRVATLVSLALALSACGDATNDKAAAPARPVDPTLVQIAPEQAANYKTQAVELADVALIQEHPGRIEANERLLTRIGATVTGRVTQVLAELGDGVRPGQVLAQVSSPELTTAQLSYLRAQSNQALAQRAVERARQLIQADVIGSAELQRRESELSIAQAEVRAALDQLRLLGLPTEAIERLRSSGSIHSEAGVVARLGGVVIDRKVSQGQVVQPGDELFTVADLSRVWVVGALPEQAARSVKRGQTVEIEVPAIDRKLNGRVVFVSDTIQPETRTVAIRTELDNSKRELKPQMLANLRIAAAPKSMPVVPGTAVVREDDRDHVFVQVEPNVFRLVPVELAPLVNQKRPVLKGLKVGDVIVSEGGFHLNNERAQRLLTGAPDANAGAKK
ncbi:MAG: efflux RND transporter periplasmic adaptor subunit [Curvibacter sp.]|jgi:cobalt-zinc-cadmium efflux system membrane fusion protein|nr:efflux RND transporter periplasmic adaptor subunit [Curvibacter sp.]